MALQRASCIDRIEMPVAAFSAYLELAVLDGTRTVIVGGVSADSNDPAASGGQRRSL